MAQSTVSSCQPCGGCGHDFCSGPTIYFWSFASCNVQCCLCICGPVTLCEKGPRGSTRRDDHNEDTEVSVISDADHCMYAACMLLLVCLYARRPHGACMLLVCCCLCVACMLHLCCMYVAVLAPERECRRRRIVSVSTTKAVFLSDGPPNSTAT